ncbi:MAG TPA: ABC transporter substrate-binding protein [Phycisphaerales bacterium]|nr:ABC transporter substrate-binding protein [Phycisphaerales bacterium]
MTRRAALGTMLAGAAGFAALGPRGERFDPRGRIVLEYWEKWTRHEGDAMERIVDAFNASQDRIVVRYNVVSDIGQKSLVSIAGGNPPDVIGLYAFNVVPYAETGAILPLDELAARAGMSLDQYTPGVRRVMRHQGKWWATVNTAGSIALYWNRAAFRGAKIDPDRPPRTIAELDEMHRRLVRTDASGALDRVGFLHREPGWWSWLWAYHFGGRIYDEALGRATVDSSEDIRAMEWMQNLSRGLGVDRTARFAESFGNYFTPENPFLTGKVAMIVQGPWIANLINAFKPDLDYGVAPFPTETAGPIDSPVGLIDTDVLVIPRGARHPGAAMEFIAFTQRQDMTEQLATAHCKPSPLAKVSEAFLANHPNRGIRVHYDILRSDRSFVAPRTRVWQQFKDEFDTQVQRMWRLEVAAPVALARLQTRVQSFIDRAAERQRRRYGQRGTA